MPEKIRQLNRGVKGISSWLKVKKAPFVIAGPCSAESEQQMLATAKKLAKLPYVHLFRAGIWKPRTRPDSFEGIGTIGLHWLKQVKDATSLLTTTEVASARHVELCLEFGIDVLWIGARTTVNPFLVQEIADSLKGVDIPVLVKNPVNPDIGLWIGAIERLYHVGLRKLAAIHRGFSSTANMEFRNNPNWPVLIELKRLLPALPVICDPSHISGRRDLIEPVSQMALDLGIEGLMIETHIEPDKALSDAKQQVTPKQLSGILSRLRTKQSTVTDADAKSRIARIRTQISHVDSLIIQQLAERMKWVQEIGRIKRKYNVSVLQINRWENLLDDHVKKAEQSGLDPEFVKAVFELIHARAVEKQL